MKYFPHTRLEHASRRKDDSVVQDLETIDEIRLVSDSISSTLRSMTNKNREVLAHLRESTSTNKQGNHED